MATHTPGPWFNVEEFVHVFREEQKGHLGRIFSVRVAADRCTHDEAVANARLIAAAPDMLAALKLTDLHFQRMLASDNFMGDDEHEAWTAIRAAIAKAEGTDATQPDRCVHDRAVCGICQNEVQG